jgi:transcriptional pleiotropic repressor
MNFNDTTKILGQALGVNAFIFDTAGQALGAYLSIGYVCLVSDGLDLKDLTLSEKMVARLEQMDETLTNVKEDMDQCLFDDTIACTGEHHISTYLPIIIHGERFGTLVLINTQKPFSDDDLIIAEYGATVVGMEMVRSRMEHAEKGERAAASIQLVLRTISYSELIAIEAVLQELNGEEGVITAAKVADQAGITRSVIVNALRKLESAGIINSRSLGMKGTYVKVLNNQLLKAIEDLSK